MYVELLVNFYVTCDVCWIMYDLGLYVGYESRSFATLDGLPGLYRLKYDSVTAPLVAIVLVVL